MKIPFNEKQTNIVAEELKIKRIALASETENLMQYIKDKAPSDLVEGAIRNRNILFIDIANLEKQFDNLKYGRNQYGKEIQERNIRQWID